MDSDDFIQRLAELALRLKHQYQAVVMTVPEYGHTSSLAREMAGLGDVIKELEDTVVIARVRAAGNGD